MGAGLSVSKTFFSCVSAGKRLRFWKLRSIMSSREVDRQQCRRLLLLASPECGGLHGVGVWGGGGCIRAGLGSLMTKQSFQLRPVRTCQSSGFQQPPKTLEPKDWAGPVSLGLRHGKKGEADNQFLLPSPPPPFPPSFRGLPRKSHGLESPYPTTGARVSLHLEAPRWTCICCKCICCEASLQRKLQRCIIQMSDGK